MKIASLVNKYETLILYGLFGFVSLGVDWLSYALLVNAGMEVTAATAIALFLSTSAAFFCNKLFVFKSRSFAASVFWPEAASFFACRAASSAFEIVCLPVMVHIIGFDTEVFGVRGFLPKMIITVIVIVMNLVTAKYLSFRDRGKDRPLFRKKDVDKTSGD